MQLVTPGIGLLFWMTVTFSLVLFILSKFAWKPILKSIKEREDSITGALNAADDARKKMDALNADNQRLLNEARSERDKMLREANDMKEEILSKARKAAEDEGRKMIQSAKESIEKEKINAMNELKAQVAELSVDMAERILRKKMEDRNQQEAFVNEHLNTIKFN